MKLVYLKLLNFRRFKEERLDFNSSFSVVYGKNGAWKSSLMDAIWFAIFGPLWKDFTRWNKENLKSFVADGKAPSKVELCFDVSWTEYRLIRVIDKWTKAFATGFIEEKEDTLYFAEEKIVWGWEITKFLESLLWVSRDVFLRSIFAKQKDIQVLSSPNAKDRRGLINSILGIDKLEWVIVSYNREKLDNDAILSDLKGNIEFFDLKSIEDEKSKIKKVIQELEKEWKALKDSLEQILKDKEVLRKKYENEQDKKKRNDIKELEVKNIETQIKRIHDSLSDKRNKLSDLNKKREYFNKNKDVFSERDSISLEIKKLEDSKRKFDEKTKLWRQKVDYKTQLASLNLKKKSLFDKYTITELSDFSKESEKLKEYLLSLENDKLNLVSEQESIKANNLILVEEWKSLTKEKDNLLKLDSDANCPTCKQKLWSYLDALIKNFDNDINKKRQEYKENLDLLAKIDEKLKPILNNIFWINNKFDFIKSWEIEVSKIITQIEAKNNEINRLETEQAKYTDIDFDIAHYNRILFKFQELDKDVLKLKAIEGEIKALPDLQKEVEKLDVDKNSLEEVVRLKQKELELIWYNKGAFIKAKESYLLLDNKVSNQYLAIQNKSEEVLNEKNNISLLDQKIEEHNKNRYKLKSLLNIAEELVFKIDVVKKYKSYLMRNLKPKIEELASSYFALTTDYKYGLIEMTEDYNLTIEGNPIEIYSGWEQDLANFCLRLALSQNLTVFNSWNHINFIILDEILWSQDEGRRWNILAALKKIEEKFSQIILISHSEEVKDIATNLIEIKAVSKNTSKIFEN